MGLHQVSVRSLPAWVDAARLLGAGDWTIADGVASASLGTHDAADLAARLRGVGLDGAPLDVTVRPPLPRDAVRAARTEDARRRRDTTPGFTRPGTRTDDEGRWSLTAEALALRIGKEAVRHLGRDVTVLDAGCGVGGNTIGFARAGARVIAVERDATRLAHAAHNAEVYGIADRVRFVSGDAATALAHETADLVFLDPPWGTTWSRERTTIDDLPDLAPLLTLARARFAHTWVKVPPSFDTRTVPGARAAAVFGEAPGDRARVKFVLLALTR